MKQCQFRTKLKPSGPGAPEQPVSQGTLPCRASGANSLASPQLVPEESPSPDLRNSAHINGMYLEVNITYHSPTQKKQNKKDFKF